MNSSPLAVCVCMIVFMISSGVRASTFGETLSSRHGKRGRTHRSRSGRDPCNVERVACAQIFFWVGVDKTSSLVSVREAYFVPYVPVKCCLFFALGSHEYTAQTYTR